MLDVDQSSVLPSTNAIVEQAGSSASNTRLKLSLRDPMNLSSRVPNSEVSLVDGNVLLQRKDCESTFDIRSIHGHVPNSPCEGPRKSIDRESDSSNQLQGLLFCYNVNSCSFFA